MIRKTAFLIIYIFFLACTSGFAQEKTNPKIDSILSVLDLQKRDTNTFHHLYGLSFEYKYIGDNQKAKEYIDIALEISRELDWPKGRAKSFFIIADTYLNRTKYDSAIIYFDRTLEICDSFNLESVKAETLLNYSNLYSEKSDYPKTLTLLFDALRIFEDLEQENRIGGALSNIGIIYYYQEEYDTALHYYQRALRIFKTTKNQSNLSFIYTNIGAIYANQDKLIKSLEYFKKAGKIKKELNELNGLCVNYQNLAEVCNHLSTFSEDSLKNLSNIYMYADGKNLKASLRDTAEYYLEKAIAIAEEIENQYRLISSMSTLGNIYFANKEYDDAIKIYKKGVSLATKLDIPQYQFNIYENLYQSYDSISKYDSAYRYHVLFSKVKDSLFSKEKQVEIGRQETKYLLEKEQALKDAEFEKQIALDKAELKRQRLLQVFLGLVILIVLIVAIFIYRSLQISKKQRKEIEDQKEIIEKKNLEILSSIRYASRIQNALLKEEEKVTPNLPEHFVFFKPRDIVSGDFYWSVKQDNWWFLAVADCTGHGVPGAFLTMLGTAYLNEIIGLEKFVSPEKILNELRSKIVNQLSQSENIEDSKDGMDISLIALNLNTLEAVWSGANNPIYIIREKRGEDIEIMESGNRVLAEIKGDKQPIGYYEKSRPFTSHKIQFKKGELFYLISDGFPDQFGGPKNKKYRYKPLKQLILNNSHKDVESQKKIFSDEFEEWKGHQQQLDDVCLLGVQL